MWDRGCGLGKEDWRGVEIRGIFTIRDETPELVESWALFCRLESCDGGVVASVFVIKGFQAALIYGGLLKQEQYFHSGHSLSL